MKKKFFPVIKEGQFIQALPLTCIGKLMRANIIAVSRNEDKLRSAMQRLDTSKNQQHKFLAVDLSKPDEVKQTVKLFLDKGAVIHILINNAGGPPSAPLIETDVLEIEKA